MQKKIDTSKAPGALGPYSQAVEIDNLVYTSGQLGICPKSGELKEGVKEQTRQALENVKAILEEAGLGMNNIIKTLVFIQDMNDFGAVNEVYAEYINGDVLPARSCVEVAKLPKGGLVEIEVIALKK
ncbi:MAG TPA: RidA family protein [Candidatus Ventrousia excrementavium]|uniref:RidA family protein n=1 Tax=Candidatus Ventrousia excrementavium TaxID=2840961 RepID=A0A9D1LLF7_9CLOT|nr:RidA family protein [Candidatus Ventrousia excrementavium]